MLFYIFNQVTEQDLPNGWIEGKKWEKYDVRKGSQEIVKNIENGESMVNEGSVVYMMSSS